MKSIETKSFILGVLATSLILVLTSSRSIESENLHFIGLPNGMAVINNSTKTLYQYKGSMSGVLDEKPYHAYKLAEDGSKLTKEE